MSDLSVWDIARDFTGIEAAALFVGENPLSGDPKKWQPVIERMRRSYDLAVYFQSNQIHQLDDNFSGEEPVDAIHSIMIDWYLYEYDFNPEDWTHTFYNWLNNDEGSNFDRQRFTRQHIAKWVDAVGLKSAYKFLPSTGDGNAGLQVQIDTANEPEFDPSDLPPELDAAHMAFRAYTNNYGSSTATPKQWLVEYLETHYPDFKPEQVQRIATVANPDKSTGRKKRIKE